MSNFEQTAAAKECKAGHRKVFTSGTDQFCECAKEAVLLACDAKIAKDKQDLLSFSGSASSTTESISTAWRGQCRVVD